MARVLLILIFCNVLMVKCLPNFEPKVDVRENSDSDYGAPLYFTPYIESGKIADARNLSRVDFPGFPDVKSYAGFFTVDKKYNSNQFLWYFPAQSYIEEQIVILWLQGGPGVSSLFGLFEENGPLEITNATFKKRETHWAKHHHLIYIDNPVGAGFSFTNDSRGYCTNQAQIGEHLYSTLVQFFQMFPELQRYKFFISGESYAGKYVPALAYIIQKKNPTAKIQINLKGLMIGNGWCDPINQINYSDYLYQIGLIDWNQKKISELYQNQIVELIKKKAWLKASQAISELREHLADCTGDISTYNYLPSHSDYNWTEISKLIQSVSIRRSIHVGNLTYHTNTDSRNIVFKFLIEDFMKSVAPWISELLEEYPILFYNGQVDIVVAYPLTVNFLRHLNFSESVEYSTAARKIVYLNSQGSVKEVGFAKTAGNLTEFLIRGAGHMVPSEKPEWIYSLILWWRRHIAGKSFNRK